MSWAETVGFCTAAIDIGGKKKIIDKPKNM